MLTGAVEVANIATVIKKGCDYLQIHCPGHVAENFLAIRRIVLVDENQFMQIPIVVEDKILKHTQGKGMC